MQARMIADLQEALHEKEANVTRAFEKDIATLKQQLTIENENAKTVRKVANT